MIYQKNGNYFKILIIQSIQKSVQPIRGGVSSVQETGNDSTETDRLFKTDFTMATLLL